MKENKYDDDVFFDRYSRMPRSVDGLAAAGEWHELRRILPSLSDKRVLDLGCGFGWHCRYAEELGASRVVGVDISEKMLAVARKKSRAGVIEYVHSPIEDYSCPPGSFDVVVSSLALHYVESFERVCRAVGQALVGGGVFVFSVEHPVFTAYGSQDWIRDGNGARLHWPVDGYFHEGRRNAVFLGENVIKYHRTLTTYLHGLIEAGFGLLDVVEPRPEEGLLDSVPDMRDEMRRPMMLLVSSRKP